MFGETRMVEIIEVKDWTLPYYAAVKIRLHSEEDFHRIAKTLDVEYIFKKGKQLLCIHGITVYRFKP